MLRYCKREKRKLVLYFPNASISHANLARIGETCALLPYVVRIYGNKYGIYAPQLCLLRAQEGSAAP